MQQIFLVYLPNGLNSFRNHAESDPNNRVLLAPFNLEYLFYDTEEKFHYLHITHAILLHLFSSIFLPVEKNNLFWSFRLEIIAFVIVNFPSNRTQIVFILHRMTHWEKWAHFSWWRQVLSVIWFSARWSTRTVIGHRKRNSKWKPLLVTIKVYSTLPYLVDNLIFHL